jgi:hypothetical protein
LPKLQNSRYKRAVTREQPVNNAKSQQPFIVWLYFGKLKK